MTLSIDSDSFSGSKFRVHPLTQATLVNDHRYTFDTLPSSPGIFRLQFNKQILKVEELGMRLLLCEVPASGKCSAMKW